MENEIIIKVDKKTAEFIVEALKYGFANSDGSLSDYFYEAFINVKQQIKSQCYQSSSSSPSSLTA